ncbi:MAG TPA: hypothetical protein VHK63_05365 [Candidatus Limnocylindria bacterium]|nr:hypothetical protein [Candidatus Limnocylindria bacterium]
MDIVLLRLVHILSGAFWFGSVITMFLFLQPTAQATAPESQRFMLHLLRDRRFSHVVLGAALLTVLAGGILFWRDSNGLRVEWMSEPPGLGFTVGAVAALLALLLFVFVGFPASHRMVAIGGRLADERRAPTDEERREVARSQATLRSVGVVVLVLLTIAAAAMSTARYWSLLL